MGGATGGLYEGHSGQGLFMVGCGCGVGVLCRVPILVSSILSALNCLLRLRYVLIYAGEFARA